jgi:signal transduction histidine kinase
VLSHLKIDRNLLFYGAHLLSLPIGIFILFFMEHGTVQGNFIKFGIISNIIGVIVTLLMIIRYNAGIRVYILDEYPLLYMRIGILFEIFLFQIAILKNWYEQEKALVAKDLQSRLEIEKLRNEISSELHDDIGTSLTKLNLQSFMVENSVLNPDEVKRYLNAMQQEIKTTMNNLRDIVWSIGINDNNQLLVDKIKSYLNEIKSSSPINIIYQIEISDQVKINDINFKHQIILIIKEIVNNALKHSKCSSINVSLSNDRLVISDNGIGFNMDEKYAGQGLKNIKKRSESINSNFTIQPNNPNGTRFEIEFIRDK